MQSDNDKKRRGRPAKSGRDTANTKAELISSGVEHFTQFGFASSGLDQILKKVSVPKGSFYYYFANKEVFGLAVIAHYDGYFCRKLDLHLKNDQLVPEQRLISFVDDAKSHHIVLAVSTAQLHTLIAEMLTKVDDWGVANPWSGAADDSVGVASMLH